MGISSDAEQRAFDAEVKALEQWWQVRYVTILLLISCLALSLFW